MGGWWWWWVVVGVEGENRNKLGACQLTATRPGSDWDGPGYVVLAFTILFGLLGHNYY